MVCFVPQAIKRPVFRYVQDSTTVNRYYGMKRTVYTWMLTLLTVFGATVASADEKVSFEVKAPMVVAKGEAVRVEFSLNALSRRRFLHGPVVRGVRRDRRTGLFAGQFDSDR